MKKYLLVAVLLSLAIVASHAQGYYPCSGTVTNVFVQNDGTLAVAGLGGLSGFTPCKIGAATSGNGWTSDTCKAAYANLLAAKVSGQQAVIWFYTDGFTCSTQPPWNLNNKAYAVDTQ